MGGTGVRAGTGAGTGGAAGTFTPPDECSTAAECDDGDPCTDQECSAAGECEYTDNTASCDDGDECTTADVCSAGVCMGAPTCGDGCGPCAEPTIAPVTAGNTTTCARKPDGVIRCWGDNALGEAGYPPDGQVGSDVDVGAPVVQVAVAGLHSCALLNNGAVRCWGSPAYGRLGYGNLNGIGDDPGETPASAGDVDLGGKAVSVSVSSDHSCAALVDGTVRCWGAGGGKLGYGDGNYDDVGDVGTPAQRGVVDVGGHVVQVAVGSTNSCGLLAGGAVRCWGAPSGLGTLALFPIGDNESPGSVPPIDLGGTATQIGVGTMHSCALLSDKTVRCWGRGESGKLGYGDKEIVGDDPVDVGGDVEFISAGGSHACAILTGGALRCWGAGLANQLGYGNTNDIGDNETPASAGDVPWLD